MKYLNLILPFCTFSQFLECNFVKIHFPEGFKKPFQQNPEHQKLLNQKLMQKKNFELSTSISPSSTQVAALGRVADLGDLYDARRDNFIGVSLFTTSLPDEAIYSTAISYSSIDYVRTESLSEKMEKFGMSAEFSLSVMGGRVVKISGSGKFLSQDKKSSKSAKVSFVYSLRTVRENLNIFFKKSTKLIDRFLLQNIDATHVVVGIEWGANVVLSLEETNTDSLDVKKIQGELGAALDVLLFSAEGSAEAEFAINHLEKSTSFSVNLVGDIVPDKIPQTIRESMTFIRNVPQLIKTENGGKGKMMNYIMMPIVTVLNILYKTNISPLIIKKVEKELTDQFMSIFQDMKDSELLIKDNLKVMSKWEFMIPENEFFELSNMKNRFDSFVSYFRAKFADLLPQFRSGKVDKSELKDLIDQYRKSNWTSQSVNKVLNNYTLTMKKIWLMNFFEGFGALFIDRRTNKNRLITSNYWKKINIVSIDLNINTFSPYVSKVAKLLKESEGEYYVEDRANLKTPVVKEYYEGTVDRTFLLEEKEYIVLISESAIVIIIDSKSYDQIAANEIPQLKNKTIAIVGSTFYNVDTTFGQITSTGIENIIKLPEKGIKWKHVGSFPPTRYHTRSTAAVNGTEFYFVTYNNILYKYDTQRRTLSECEYSHGSFYSHATVSVIANKILYFISNSSLYYYDGIIVKSIAVTNSIRFAGLFELRGNVCRVGGDLADRRPYYVHCYDPSSRMWSIVGKTNEARYYPAVIKTRYGVLIFGGLRIKSNSKSEVLLNVAELLNYKTKIWSYIPSPPAMIASKYLAVKFYS